MPATPKTGLHVYHGTHRWNGGPVVIPKSKKGNYECGPGWYTTTSGSCAKHYGRSIMHAVLDPELRWLEHANIGLDDVRVFLKETNGLHKTNKLLNELESLFARRQYQGQSLPEYWAGRALINLGIEQDAWSGTAGPQLAKWLTAMGVDAILESHANKDWVVIVNPNCVQSVQPITSDAMIALGWDLPKIKDQIQALHSIPVEPKKMKM